MRVIIIGGGWAGTAAAIAARKAGAEVCLIEKTDMLLGCGNAGGIMRNNGRFTAAEEMIALGGGELFQLIDRIASSLVIITPHSIRSTPSRHMFVGWFWKWALMYAALHTSAM